VDKVLISYARDCGYGAGQGTWVELGIGSAYCRVSKPLSGLFQDGEDRRHHRLSTSAAAMVLRAIRHSTPPNQRGALSARDEWAVARGQSHDGFALDRSTGNLFNLLLHISVYAKYRRSCVILQMSWAHRQVRKAYPQFVSEFDRLRPQDVIWTPYTAAVVQTRAPYRLSSLCTRDETYWLTKANLVFDIDMEPYCVERMMRQFGRRQHFSLLPRASQAVPRSVNE
jgi:hypothetical protein